MRRWSRNVFAWHHVDLGAESFIQCTWGRLTTSRYGYMGAAALELTVGLSRFGMMPGMPCMRRVIVRPYSSI